MPPACSGNLKHELGLGLQSGWGNVQFIECGVGVGVGYGLSEWMSDTCVDCSEAVVGMGATSIGLFNLLVWFGMNREHGVVQKSSSHVEKWEIIVGNSVFSNFLFHRARFPDFSSELESFA